ncbi:hypothetical protein, partial [Pseudomonas aeruginosa]
ALRTCFANGAFTHVLSAGQQLLFYDHVFQSYSFEMPGLADSRSGAEVGQARANGRQRQRRAQWARRCWRRPVAPAEAAAGRA